MPRVRLPRCVSRETFPSSTTSPIHSKRRRRLVRTVRRVSPVERGPFRFARPPGVLRFRSLSEAARQRDRDETHQSGIRFVSLALRACSLNDRHGPSVVERGRRRRPRRNALNRGSVSSRSPSGRARSTTGTRTGSLSEAARQRDRDETPVDNPPPGRATRRNVDRHGSPVHAHMLRRNVLRREHPRSRSKARSTPSRRRRCVHATASTSAPVLEPVLRSSRGCLPLGEATTGMESCKTPRLRGRRYRRRPPLERPRSNASRTGIGDGRFVSVALPRGLAQRTKAHTGR